MIAPSIHDRTLPATLVAQELVARLHDLYAGPAALPEIVALGTGAVPALEALLRGPSQSLHHSRALAADALVAIGGPQAVAALLRALHDCAGRRLEPIALQAEDVVISRIAEPLAEERLARCNREAVIQGLLEALRRRPYPACARALGRLGDERAIPALISCLFEDAARAAAVEALRAFGAASLPALRGALAAPSPTPAPAPAPVPAHADGTEAPVHVAGRAAAAGLAAQLGDRAAVRHALTDRERAVRVAAALALVGRDGADAPARAVEVLLSALDEPDAAHANVLVQTLRGVGAALDESVLELLAAEPPTEAGRRRQQRAARLASDLGLAAAVTPLAAFAVSPDPRLRVAALEALARMPAAQERHLAAFLADPELPIAQRALEVLRARMAVAGRAASSLRHIFAWLQCTPMGRSRWKRGWRAAWLLITAHRARRPTVGPEQI